MVYLKKGFKWKIISYFTTYIKRYSDTQNYSHKGCILAHNHRKLKFDVHEHLDKALIDEVCCNLFFYLTRRHVYLSHCHVSLIVFRDPIFKNTTHFALNRMQRFVLSLSRAIRSVVIAADMQ